MLIEQINPTIKVSAYKEKTFWIVTVIDEYNEVRDIRYMGPDGAFRQVEIELQFAYYRIKARTEILPYINTRTLTYKEFVFINKLYKNNCRSISKRMYGYLNGIWERNKK